MHVVLCHTDLRLYWPDRLLAFHGYCRSRGASFSVVEIAGKGSPYAFGGSRSEQPKWWHCIHPDKAMEDLDGSTCAREVVAKLTELEADVAIGGALAFASGAGVVRWGLKAGKKVAIMDDARLVDVPRSRLVNWVKRRIYQEVDAVLLPAPGHAADYKFWGVPERSMHFGVNVVNNDLFRDGATTARASGKDHRARLQLPERFLLGVGRQVEKKNWMGLLNAWGGFKQKNPRSDLELVLLGGGPDRPKLEERLRSAGWRDVHFHDFVSQEQIVSYYALAEAVVLPSRAGETWGLVVNEAMACGLPVIVSRQCGCASTLVKEGVNGWMVDAESMESIELAIRGLANAPRDRLVEMGRSSSRIIGEWGLSRFCEGAWQAVQYALAAPKRPVNSVNHLIVNLWNGRYRPT